MGVSISSIQNATTAPHINPSIYSLVYFIIKIVCSPIPIPTETKGARILCTSIIL